MQLITDEYRKLNENLHNKNKEYGTSGWIYSDDVLKLCNDLKTQDVLDYGCGKSTLANTLPFQIKKYDPAIRAFHEEPEPAEIVVCTDVLEHIEPELLNGVLEHIKSKSNNIIYFAISTIPSVKKLEDGRNAHLIVQTPLWWLSKLFELFDILTYKKMHETIIVVCKKIIIQDK